ncbi:CPCC family cysteine-rich protein [Leminorella grimontii]|uniref:CPCC family cysteine-rich protein n=1 Tax=Leminorella grimontii TaxID=82981 RepID=UPI00322046A2
MKIEFTYNEVIEFIRLYSLFKTTAEDRTLFLIEHGVIDDNSSLESAKKKYNQIIYDDLVFSRLIRNGFWENIVRSITGNEITILDHRDDTIKGVCCDACGYIVFENREDAFYEICPVCGWQNDGKVGDEYSSCNRCSMNDFKATEDFSHRVALGDEKYILSSK